MNDFVAKPIDAEKLIEQIVKWSSQISIPTEGKKSMTTFELMNSETLQKLGNETSPEMLPEIVSIFIKEMEERINSLPVAVDELDRDELIARAHAIKSSAGTFGALGLEDSARRIEQLGRDDKLDELLPRWQGPTGEFVFGQVRSRYKALVREIASRFQG